MNREDIIRMAREASYPSFQFTSPSTLERFAALVAAAEREACAQLCDEIAQNATNPTASDCVAAIRKRTI